MPLAPTRRQVTSTPSALQLRAGVSTAGCSMALVMTCLRAGAAARTAPRIARLSASVPPLVKTISARIGVDQRGHLPARRFQALLRRLPEMVDAGRVTIRLAEARHHRLQNFGRDGVVALWSK